MRAIPSSFLGDFNDGPGLDEYERLFGRSGVEIVIGEEDDIRLFDPHAETMLRRGLGGARAKYRAVLGERALDAGASGLRDGVS